MKKIWMILAVLCVFPAFAAAQSPFEEFYEKWSSESFVSSVYVSRAMLDFVGSISFGQDDDLLSGKRGAKRDNNHFVFGSRRRRPS